MPSLKRIARLTGSQHLYFYDAIAPIIDADSIDYNIAWKASRYGRGGADYINCPLSREEYFGFIEALKAAEKVPGKEFEKVVHFEGCMPVEEMAERGDLTLAFGPMKPVGLPDPRTGREAFAVVQLRQDNRHATLFNMVGFQTKLTLPGTAPHFPHHPPDCRTPISNASAACIAIPSSTLRPAWTNSCG